MLRKYLPEAYGRSWGQGLAAPSPFSLGVDFWESGSPQGFPPLWAQEGGILDSSHLGTTIHALDLWPSLENGIFPNLWGSLSNFGILKNGNDAQNKHDQFAAPNVSEHQFHVS